MVVRSKSCVYYLPCGPRGVDSSTAPCHLEVHPARLALPRVATSVSSTVVVGVDWFGMGAGKTPAPFQCIGKLFRHSFRKGAQRRGLIGAGLRRFCKFHGSKATGRTLVPLWHGREPEIKRQVSRRHVLNPDWAHPARLCGHPVRIAETIVCANGLHRPCGDRKQLKDVTVL